MLGHRAQTGATLTAWRRLSSFCRSLMDGRCLTQALLAPSGVLCTGKGQGESWVSPKLPLLSCQAALGKSCPQLRRHLSPAGELCSPIWLCLGRPPVLPQQCAHPQLLQCLGAAEREENRRQAPLPPRLWAGAGACTALPRGRDTGARRSPMGQDRSAPQALAPSVLPEQLLLPFPCGDQEVTRGCRS